MESGAMGNEWKIRRHIFFTVAQLWPEDKPEMPSEICVLQLLDVRKPAADDALDWNFIQISTYILSFIKTDTALRRIFYNITFLILNVIILSLNP